MEVVDARPSATTIVTLAVPVCPETGVNTIVRPEPDPPSVMPDEGRRVGLSEVAFTSRVAGSDSASPTVTAIGEVAVLVKVVWLGIVARVGGVFRQGPPATLVEARILQRSTSELVTIPLLLLSVRKLEPSSGRETMNLTSATSAAVTRPLPLVSPSRTRKLTVALPVDPPAAGTMFVTATVIACALLTPPRLIVNVFPLAVAAPATFATPAVTAAFAEETGLSNVSTSVTPPASWRHSMPPPPACGSGIS